MYLKILTYTSYNDTDDNYKPVNSNHCLNKHGDNDDDDAAAADIDVEYYCDLLPQVK